LNSTNINLGNDTTLSCGDSLVINLGSGSSYEWSTGDTTSSITIKQPGTYSVRVYQGFCETRDTITVNFYSEMTIGNDTAIFCGDTLTLTPSLVGDSYLWSTGDVSPSINVDRSGVYWVEVTKGSCILRDTVLVTVMEGNLGWATDTSACLSLNLDAFLPNALSYLWSNNEVTPAITVTSSGTYWVQVTLSNGCIYRDTIQVTIDTQVPDIQIVLGDTVVQSQNVIVQADSINPSYTYLWDFGPNAQPSTATGPGPHTVIFDSVGNQTIQLIVISGCGSDTSIKTVYVSPVSNEPSWASQVQIYPNPFSEQIVIHLPNHLSYEVKVLDILGKLMYQSTQMTSKVFIPTQSWKQGVYILQIQHGETLLTHKIIRE
jgi:PKD repeat protein